MQTARETFSNRNLLVITIAQTFFMFTAMLWWPYKSLYILELGATKEQLGIIATVETVSSLLFQFPGGLLADRYGRRKLIIAGTMLRILTPASYLLAQHWTHAIPAAVLSSAAMLGSPARMALIAESIPPEKRSSSLAIYSTVTSIPTIITGLMGGVIVDSLGVVNGIHIILYASAFTALISVVLSYLFIKETLVTPMDDIKPPSIFEQIKECTRIPREVQMLTVVSAISAFTSRLSMSYMVIYGVEEVGLTKTEWGLIGTAVSIISTIIKTPVGMLSNRIGKKKVIIASRVLNALSVIGFTFSQGFWHMAFVRGVGGIGNGLGGTTMGFMGGPVWQSLLADMTSSKDRARVMGMMGTLGGIISTPGSWMGGYMYDNISPELPFQLNFILDITATAIFLIYVNEKRSVETVSTVDEG